MDFISNSEHQEREMIAELGIASIAELFCDVPQAIMLPPLKHNDGLSEYEGLCLMESIAKQNTFCHYDNYMGGGAYEHHIPAIVSSITSKAEFLTAYTPYQPEISQGFLQSIFEYQSAICTLTGMDASNASVYDAGSACAEAALMALRLNKNRSTIRISAELNPHYLEVVKLYLSDTGYEYETVSDEELSEIEDSTAAILIENPNFCGEFKDLKNLIQKAHEKGALVIVCGNPLAYCLYAPPGELGADIAVGSTQPFGLALNFGGPYVGYIACKQEHVRQLPGRIVGETTDVDGKRGFVLTLQAREQHIRREKATSNICSNQALAALASLVAMLWYGKEGTHQLALTNFQRAEYLKKHLLSISGVALYSQEPTFNEFTVKLDKSVDDVIHEFKKHHILPGIKHPHLNNHLIVAVTETKNLEQLNRFISIAREVM